MIDFYHVCEYLSDAAKAIASVAARAEGEAHRILQRLEFHYTPKHASWLNMVEIEIGVLRGQCLDRRIGERDLLESEIAEWLDRRERAFRGRWLL